MKVVLKLLLIGVLLLLLAVPIAMLQGLVWERQERGREVADDIARSTSRAQRLVGPLLRVEVERTVRKVRMIGQDGALRSEEELVHERESRLLTPLRVHSDGEMRTEIRRRGLFETLVYHTDMSITADFAAVELGAPESDSGVVAHRIIDAALVLGLGDTRGIRSLEAKLDGEALIAEPGTGVFWLDAGVQLPLDPSRLGRGLPLELKLTLAGTESIRWVPVGDDTRVTLHSTWPHPSSVGDYLPDVLEISDQGFTAEWRVSRLATQAAQGVRNCGAGSGSCPAVDAASFGVRLIDPIDRYLKTDRSIKYAWLFIVLVFGTLFFFELLRSVRLHPLQYGLTGLALAVFFLLLLSLSEHIGFAPAYALAATACVALISVYAAASLGSRGRSLGFATLLAGLYGVLYGLLQSEDYALLMGSLVLFGLLAVAMLLTRRLDWYRLNQPGTGVA